MNFKIIKLINLLITFLLLLWIAGNFLEFIITIFPSTISLLPFLKYNYSIVCHTQTEKLFNYFDFHTLLCSRCTGIYLGGFLSSFLILLGIKFSINTKFLLLSSIPIFIDIFLYTIDVYKYSQTIALSTGLLLGSIGFFYIHKAILELLLKTKDKN